MHNFFFLVTPLNFAMNTLLRASLSSDQLPVSHSRPARRARNGLSNESLSKGENSMSFLVKQKSAMLFGNAGVDSEMQEAGYMRTLCTACIDKETGEDHFIDLHITRDHLHQLIRGAAAALVLSSSHASSVEDVDLISLQEQAEGLGLKLVQTLAQIERKNNE
jgi:hypothetical protein